MKFSKGRISVDRHSGSATAKRQSGFVLVEIIVAMILLAIALSSLAALMYSVSQQGMVASANAYRNGVLMEQVNKYEGLPYASVPANGIDSVLVTTGPYQYSRVVRFSEPVANTSKSIVVIVKPTNPKYRADTATFVRTNARVPLMLCTVGCAAN
jgi:prepilin-type N-terminal cleavage/methylation domain-containing protein